jgi:hypothetical protein
VLTGPLGQIVTDLDDALMEGKDCTPVQVTPINPTLRAFSDMDIGLDGGMVHMPHPSAGVEISYSLEWVWPHSDMMLEAHFDCSDFNTGAEGDVTVQRTPGIVLTDPEAPTLATSGMQKPLSPSGHGLTDVGQMFPKDGFGIIMADLGDPDTARSVGSIGTVDDEGVELDEIEPPINPTTPPREEEL